MLTESRRRPALVFRVLLSLLLCGGLPGCGIAYLAQATQGQWRVMRARRPIDRVLSDPATTPQLKSRLELVLDAREFASRELSLPDNGSYRSYADLGRPYVVWNVVAAPEFSVVPLHWCFPFTGCLSYRGYFRERNARAYAAHLAERGNDTLVAGVAAYSTLGHFDDPVLNTMMRYGTLDLVATMFHELAHQLIYVKGDSVFNESFASMVEEEGLRRWLAARNRSLELQDFLGQRSASRAIVDALAEGRGELDALYHQPLDPDRMRVRKRELMMAIGERVRALEQQRQMQHSGFDAWIDAGLNNAHLASIATYSDCVPGFQQLLDRNGGDLPAFYAAVRKISRRSEARRQLCRDSSNAWSADAIETAPRPAPPPASSSEPATAEPRP